MQKDLINIRHSSVLLFVLLMFCSRLSLAVDSRPLVLGITPFISTVSLFERFSALSQYLTQKLGREVILTTATNPNDFLDRVEKREYDLMFASPMIVLRALDGGNYQMGAVSVQMTQPLLMVSSETDLMHIGQLAHKRVALPPQDSIVNFMAAQWFMERGLKAEALPELVTYNSHNAAYQAALSGDVEAALVASFAVKQLRKKLPVLRVIASGDNLPGSGILYAANFDEELKEQLTTLLVELKFSQQGREVLNRISLSPFRRGDRAEYEVIRPYLPPRQPAL